MHTLDNRRWTIVMALTLESLVGVFTATSHAESPSGPLAEYVHAEDPSYHWELVHTTKGPGHTTHVLEMVSQTWRTTEDVDRTEWKHWLIVTKPDKVATDCSLLVISGGRNGGDPPENSSEQAVILALGSQSVVSELKMVPNQPLVFRQDGERRFEDDLIAYTWDKFMTTADPNWIARFPMVKSAVRAMDTVQEFLQSEEGGEVTVKEFVVAGASKRGWTTWLTAAMDSRVAAIVPIVIDVLNVRPSMEHHFAAYGFWAPAVGDYVEHKITERRDTPEYADLLKIEDPFFYRDCFSMPKYVVNASGDQFFLPDSSQFYFDELPGEKLLRYVPNADHSLRGSDALQGILAFYHAIAHDHARPQFDWSFGENGKLRVVCQEEPLEVRLWQATNEEQRDFRLETIDRAYRSQAIPKNGDGSYDAQVSPPEQGWTAYFAEVTFPSPGPFPYKFSTPVRVIPDVLPHEGQLGTSAAGN